MGNRESKAAIHAATYGRLRPHAVPTQNYEGTQGIGEQPKLTPSPTELAEKSLELAKEHERLAQHQKETLDVIMPSWHAQMHQLADGLYKWFHHQGFWPKNWCPRDVANPFGDTSDVNESITISMAEYIRLKKMEKLGLIVTEVAECMEAVRQDDYGNELEELADIDVRLLDYKGGFGLAYAAPAAFREKMLKNYDRPWRHGKEF